MVFANFKCPGCGKDVCEDPNCGKGGPEDLEPPITLPQEDEDTEAVLEETQMRFNEKHKIAIQNTIDILKALKSNNQLHKFKMSDWIRIIDERKPYYGDAEGEFCNTAACLAGWCAIANRPKDISSLLINPYIIQDAKNFAMQSAAELFGLDYDSEDKLFMMAGLSGKWLITFVDNDNSNWLKHHILNLQNFDKLLPMDTKIEAGIEVLEILLKELTINWPKAIAKAIKSTNNNFHMCISRY